MTLHEYQFWPPAASEPWAHAPRAVALVYVAEPLLFVVQSPLPPELDEDEDVLPPLDEELEPPEELLLLDEEDEEEPAPPP